MVCNFVTSYIYKISTTAIEVTGYFSNEAILTIEFPRWQKTYKYQTFCSSNKSSFCYSMARGDSVSKTVCLTAFCWSVLDNGGACACSIVLCITIIQIHWVVGLTGKTLTALSVFYVGFRI